MANTLGREFPQSRPRMCQTCVHGPLPSSTEHPCNECYQEPGLPKWEEKRPEVRFDEKMFLTGQTAAGLELNRRDLRRKLFEAKAYQDGFNAGYEAALKRMTL